MTMTTPNFDDTEVKSTDGAVATEQVNDGDIEGTGEDALDAEVNDDANLDVDVPDDTDEVPAEAVKTNAAKPAKASTATPRTKAPEGYVKPVEFAKILGTHLNKVVPPQVVYSYIKNNQGEGARNPFPTHEIEGYAWYIKPEEGLGWWDAKNTRVAASKDERAKKAAAKAAVPAAASPDATPVVEAE